MKWNRGETLSYEKFPPGPPFKRLSLAMGWYRQCFCKGSKAIIRARLRVRGRQGQGRGWAVGVAAVSAAEASGPRSPEVSASGLESPATNRQASHSGGRPPFRLP